MPYVVALTGGIGSGKTTIAEMFARCGVKVIDADIVSRQVVQAGTPALKKIHQYFGDRVLLADGGLNRSWLRQQIFADPESKNWLNNLLHPLIQQRTQQLIDQIADDWCLWVVPLLAENRLHNRADRVLVVDVDEETQVRRTMARDNITRQQAADILAAQASRQSRLEIADDVIDNSGSPAEQQQKVAMLYQRYQSLASAKKGSVP